MSPQTKTRIVRCHGIWADGSRFNKPHARIVGLGGRRTARTHLAHASTA